ncbi:MAG: response regulator transcription factor [Gammaproteobacteria bacterium]
MIRTYLIDDHNAVRQSVATMLETSDDIRVVGQAEELATGVIEVTAMRPDVVLLDLKLPGKGGLASIPDLFAGAPNCKIVVFTMYDNPAFVWETVNAGAAGYLLKTASKEELLHAIRSVASGAGYLQAAVTMPVLKRVAHDARSSGSRRNLSPRELQILESLSDGLSNKTIAYQLTLSEETVKSHLRSLYEKLGAADRAHAVSIALRQRLIE